jgi:biopolymer transport protein ExbB
MFVGALAIISIVTSASIAAQQAQQPAAQQPAAPAAQAAPPPSRVLTDLRQAVQRLRDQERQLAQERENRFRAELQRMERQAQEATARRNAAEARSNALDRQWNENEQRIAETTALLRESEGNLGELFGVTRQVAGDAATVLSQSVLSTQYGVPAEGEERSEFLRRVAGARALPSIVELERLWYEIVREMTDAGRVVKFRAPVAPLDDESTPDDESKSPVEMDVVRVGPFTVSSNGEYLGYLPSQR